MTILAQAPRICKKSRPERNDRDDLRRFRVAVDSKPAAEIGLSARIVDKNGKIIASRLFEESEGLDKVEPPQAVAAFSAAFGRLAKDMIAWTVRAL